jgi:hypothetical protein
MNWAQRRKLTYIAIVIGFFAIVAFGIYYHISSNVVMTCFDHKQDQGEYGVDCGGPCTNYCSYQLSDPVIEWVRVFPVTPGIVNAVAYIEHDYPTAGAPSVGYDFKLYDANNTLLADRAGTTFLGPAGTSAIVETRIPIGSGAVSIARFSFDDPIAWEKIPINYSQIIINTDNNTTSSFNDGQPGTRLTAVLQNQSRFSFTNMEAVAIYYDKDGNAITASKVLVPSFAALASRTVYFTWPYAVTGVDHTEIIPRFDPFTSQYN